MNSTKGQPKEKRREKKKCVHAWATLITHSESRSAPVYVIGGSVFRPPCYVRPGKHSSQLSPAASPRLRGGWGSTKRARSEKKRCTQLGNVQPPPRGARPPSSCSSSSSHSQPTSSTRQFEVTLVIKLNGSKRKVTTKAERGFL